MLSLHGIALALVVGTPTAGTRPMPTPRLTLIDLGTETAPAPAPAKPAEAKLRPVTAVSPQPLPAKPDAVADPIALAPALLAALDGMQGSSCALATLTRDAITADPPATAAIASVPRGERSVANAIMMWDGRWSADRRLARVQALVAMLVASAPEACRTEVQTGPTLIAIGPVEDATMLVLGSGVWRWQDVAGPAATASGSTI